MRAAAKVLLGQKMIHGQQMPSKEKIKNQDTFQDCVALAYLRFNGIAAGVIVRRVIIPAVGKTGEPTDALLPSTKLPFISTASFREFLGHLQDLLGERVDNLPPNAVNVLEERISGDSKISAVRDAILTHIVKKVLDNQ